MARRVGRHLEPLARDVLFGPLWIEVPEPWDRDPDGFEIVPYGLSLTPRDLARFGYLYLREGAWDGRRIVSEEWVSKSTVKRTEGGPPENCPYGYLWWTTDETGHRAFFAAGYGGQYVYVVPDLALVVVTTAAMGGEKEPRDDVRAVIREIVRAAR
jgi:CubicO group peptidase (beta-lactamase class C family)